jgi:hypothetical protein
MPDVYIDIGALSNKANKEYNDAATAAMRKGIETAVKNSPGFTTKKTDKTTSGYTIRLKVTDIVFGTNTVTCKLSGELLKWPKPEMISTSLTGNGKSIGNSSAAAVADTIESIAESMTKDKILPTIRRLEAQ